MDISNKTIWQVAAGDTEFNYVDLCLKWGVILKGCGSAGPWPDCETVMRDVWKESSRRITNLRQFAFEMKHGDIVVLRMGTSYIHGVGIIDGDYQHHEGFDDVDGWDLDHVRRVRWVWKSLEKPKEFKTYTLKLGDTVQLMDSEEVKAWIASPDIKEADKSEGLLTLPGHAGQECTVDHISEYLFGKGVSNNSIRHLADQIGELTQIAKWYNDPLFFGKPSEHETVAYLVIPLLRALGWTPQKMAVEWNCIDIALFSSLPRDSNCLDAVVEAKQIKRSCLTAKSQAEDYASKPERASCRRLIVTDGLRYGIFLRGNDGHFCDSPSAYLNLAEMRDEYPVLDCKGAKEAFYLLSSDWRPNIAP